MAIARACRLPMALVLLAFAGAPLAAQDDAAVLKARIADLESQLQLAQAKAELAKASIATLQAQIVELQRMTVPFSKLRDLDSDDLYRDGALTDTAADVLGLAPEERRRVAAAFAGAEAGMAALLVQHLSPPTAGKEATLSLAAFDDGGLKENLLASLRAVLSAERAEFLLARIGDGIDQRHLHFGDREITIRARREEHGVTLELASGGGSSSWGGLQALPEALRLLKPHLPKHLLGDAEPSASPAAPVAPATPPTGTADF